MIKFTPLLLLASLFIGGCAHTESLPVAEQAAASQSPSQVNLVLEQSMAVGNLTLLLQKIEDSRCPLNANCIRFGSVATQVRVNDAKGNSVTKVLYLGDPLPAPDNRGPRSADTVTVSLDNKAYRLILMEVQPYPVFPATTEVKTAKVSVTAL